MKEELVEFLRPTAWKIILTIFFPTGRIYRSVVEAMGFEYSLKAIGLDYPSLQVNTITLFIFSALTMLFLYPMMCSIFTLYEYYKRKGLEKLRNNRILLGLVIISLLIFNPVSHVIIVIFLWSILL